MIWLLLCLAIFSDSFLQPVLGKINIGLPGQERQPIEDEVTTFAKVEDFALPASHVTVDLNSDRWEGKTWHYEVLDEAGKTKNLSVFIVDLDVSADDYDYDWMNNTALTTRDLMPRDNWVCKRFSSCWSASKFCGRVVQATVNVVVDAAMKKLRANNNELAKRIVDGVIIGFAIGLTDGIVSWYVTNKIAANKAGSSTDSCHIDSLAPRLDIIEENIRAIMELLRTDVPAQVETCMEAKIETTSVETTKQIDGQDLVHSIRFTKDKNDMKYVGGC